MTARPRLMISNLSGQPTPAELRIAADILLSGGFVILPSDSCYALAAIPFSAATQHKINKVLRRPPMPMSLAFPTVEHARQWITPNPVADELLSRFCPGAITVVTRASPCGIPAQFFHTAMGRTNRTIGIRVPDSAVERAVAAATAYPTTTVAICHPDTRAPVTSFGLAVDLVRSGLERAAETAWGAIDGARFNATRSTVVAVTASGPRIIREGDIPAAEIRRTVGSDAGLGD